MRGSPPLRNTFRLCYRWAATFRLEGADDSFHRTPRVHHPARRRGGGVANCGACAAARDPVIGFFSSGSPDAYTHLLTAFRQGLAETGYVEGQNAAIEFRWAKGQFDRLPALAPTKSPEAEPQLRDVQTAARAIGQQIHILNASTERDVDTAFATLVQQLDGALLVTNDAFFHDQREQLVALAARHAVPTIYDRRAYAAAGGLISYGTHYVGAFRQLGIYTARILNGTKPADLPVEQSAKFELVINLKTAKALGLDVPPTLLARADEVIE